MRFLAIRVGLSLVDVGLEEQLMYTSMHDMNRIIIVYACYKLQSMHVLVTQVHHELHNYMMLIHEFKYQVCLCYGVCVCVCVCVRERERERETHEHNVCCSPFELS